MRPVYPAAAAVTLAILSPGVASAEVAAPPSSPDSHMPLMSVLAVGALLGAGVAARDGAFRRPPRPPRQTKHSSGGRHRRPVG